MSARTLAEAGDRARAIDEVEAALALDPHFLAAQTLRDRLIASETPATGADSRPATVHGGPQAEDRPLVSTEGYARFEARAKRRRVDRRIEAARAALARKKIHQAASALDEIVELDPNLPDIVELRAQLETLRRGSRSHVGPWLAAAAVFLVGVLGASYLQDSSALLSHPFSSAVALVTPLEPEPIGTAGTIDAVEPPQIAVSEPLSVPQANPERVPTPESRPVTPEPATVAAVAPAQPVVAPPQAALQDEPLTIAAVAPPPASAPRPFAPPPASAPVAVASITTPIPPRTDDDEVMIQQALQRYRSAYEGLDARSAHAVWPAVNQAALARAFDGLASQSLTFDSCDVRLRGDAADAICSGTARYVPKVGSRAPRVEPRTWNFRLRKAGAEWQIDNARAER